jgi:hypothetical protein
MSATTSMNCQIWPTASVVIRAFAVGTLPPTQQEQDPCRHR